MFSPNKIIICVSGAILFFSYSYGFSAPLNFNPGAFNTSPIPTRPAAKPLKPGLTLPIKKSPTPITITDVNPKGCIKKGSIITLSGNSFDRSSKKTLTMTDSSLTVELKTIQWTDKTIKATIPNDRRLAEGKSYQVGIKAISHTGWLTTPKSIRLCSKVKTSVSTLSVTAPQNNQSQTTEQYENWENHEEDDYDYSADYEFYEPTPSRLDYTNRMGSLIGSGLPPPREALLLRTTDKKQPSYEPAELIVVTVNMDDAIAIQQEFSAYGIRVKRRQNLGNIGLVISTLGLTDGTQADQILTEIRAQYPNLWVSLNTRYQLQSADNHKKVMAMVGWDKASSQCGKD